jgi:hypothetical protein
MRACSRVALVLMALSASFGLAGCAAIDDLKFAIAQWFESARFPDGVLPDNDLPNATPINSETRRNQAVREDAQGSA